LHAWPLYYTKIFHLFIYNNCCCNKIDRELLIIIEEWDGGDAMEPVGHGWDGWMVQLRWRKRKGPAS
jgi:hypothetical protein